jgi:hypothetical protein
MSVPLVVQGTHLKAKSEFRMAVVLVSYILQEPQLKKMHIFRTPFAIKIRAFWDVTACNLVGVNRRFRCVYCLYYQTLIMEAETSVYSETTLLPYINQGTVLIFINVISIS